MHRVGRTFTVGIWKKVVEGTEDGRNRRWDTKEDNLEFKLSKFSVLVMFKLVDLA